MSKRMAKLKILSNVFSTIGNAVFTIGYDVFLSLTDLISGESEEKSKTGTD